MNEPTNVDNKDVPVSDANSLSSLEREIDAKVDRLLQHVANLRRENSNLRDQRASLLAERANLVEKSEQARTRVEAMIARLKTMELGV